jgi:hypothetical protein
MFYIYILISLKDHTRDYCPLKAEITGSPEGTPSEKSRTRYKVKF